MSPLYMTVKQAAQYAGIGEHTMRDFLASADPPPYLRIGRKRLIQAAALAGYLERKQEVKARNV